MVIELLGMRGRLSIEVLHVQTELVPDQGTMQWKVAVEAYGLRGEYDKVYILPDHYEQFLLEFRILEQDRRGSASLVSMSPEELQLIFRNLDVAGHMLVEGQLGRYTYVGDQSHIQKLIFAFEFDPTLLPSLVEQFAALPSFRASS